MHTLLSIWAFPVRYLAEKPLRATYLILTLLLAFTSYTLLIMLGLPFAPNDTPKITNAGVIGIGASYGSLPARYAREIARLSGIESVQYGDFMPVQCQTGITATLNGMAGIGASPIPNITQSLKPTELQSWRNGFNGMLVGDALAKRCHWHTGELLTLQGEMGAQPTIKVRIIAIYHVGAENPALNQIAVVHYRYLNGLNPADKQGSVMWMSAKAADPRQAARLATIIDIHFANSSPPTESSASAAGQG
ncbi:MAG: hypothetical protein ACRES9_01570, partial [Gammaproteobacteria bacterium]